MDYIEAEPLNIKKHFAMFPEGNVIVIKIPRRLTNDIVEVVEQFNKYNPDSGKIPEKWRKWDSFIVHFDNHLYTPLIIWRKNKEEIKSVPVKLNKGETKFVEDFKKFLNENKELFKNKDVFLLRNLSRKGVGFFISSGFYPDFIIWVKNKNKQHMIFVDPKGIRNLGNFNDDKIQLCVSYVKEIEKKVNEELKRKGEPVTLILDAFIISVSSYDDIKATFGEGKCAKEEFNEHNIIFQEDDEYLKELFKKI